MDPNVQKKELLTDEQKANEDRQIMQAVETMGTRWTAIVRVFPGRMPAWSKSVLRVQSTLARSSRARAATPPRRSSGHAARLCSQGHPHRSGL